MQTSAIANQYLKSVKKACPRAFRAKLTAELNDGILEFLNENPYSSLADIQKYFGEPTDFVTEFLDSMGNEQKIQSLNKIKYLKIISVIIALIAVVITSTCIYLARDSATSSVYYSEEIVYLEVIEVTD